MKYHRLSDLARLPAQTMFSVSDKFSLWGFYIKRPTNNGSVRFFDGDLDNWRHALDFSREKPDLQEDFDLPLEMTGDPSDLPKPDYSDDDDEDFGFNYAAVYEPVDLLMIKAGIEAALAAIGNEHPTLDGFISRLRHDRSAANIRRYRAMSRLTHPSG